MYYSPFINIYMLVINMMWLIHHKFFDDSFYSCDYINGFHEKQCCFAKVFISGFQIQPQPHSQSIHTAQLNVPHSSQMNKANTEPLNYLPTVEKNCEVAKSFGGSLSHAKQNISPHHVTTYTTCQSHGSMLYHVSALRRTDAVKRFNASRQKCASSCFFLFLSRALICLPDHKEEVQSETWHKNSEGALCCFGFCHDLLSLAESHST